jgi:hypothetical protein
MLPAKGQRMLGAARSANAAGPQQSDSQAVHDSRTPDARNRISTSPVQQRKASSSNGCATEKRPTSTYADHVWLEQAAAERTGRLDELREARERLAALIVDLSPDAESAAKVIEEAAALAMAPSPSGSAGSAAPTGGTTRAVTSQSSGDHASADNDSLRELQPLELSSDQAADAAAATAVDNGDTAAAPPPPPAPMESAAAGPPEPPSAKAKRRARSARRGGADQARRANTQQRKQAAAKATQAPSASAGKKSPESHHRSRPNTTASSSDAPAPTPLSRPFEPQARKQVSGNTAPGKKSPERRMRGTHAHQKASAETADRHLASASAPASSSSCAASPAAAPSSSRADSFRGQGKRRPRSARREREKDAKQKMSSAAVASPAPAPAAESPSAAESPAAAEPSALAESPAAAEPPAAAETPASCAAKLPQHVQQPGAGARALATSAASPEQSVQCANKRQPTRPARKTGEHGTRAQTLSPHKRSPERRARPAEHRPKQTAAPTSAATTRPVGPSIATSTASGASTSGVAPAPAPATTPEALANDEEEASLDALPAQATEDTPVHVAWKYIGPQMRIATGQVLLLLREFSNRLAGREGKVQVGVIRSEQEAGAASVLLAGSDSEVPFDFDSVSHVLLPWPLPNASALEAVVGADARRQTAVANTVDAEGLRPQRTPGLGRYAAGQELVVLLDRSWFDAVVVHPPDDMRSTVHQITVAGSQHALLLHPWNHAPHLARSSTCNDVWTRYSADLGSEHSSITDALSGQRLSVYHQCVPLKLAPTVDGLNAAEHGGLRGVTEINELFNWLSSAHADRREVPSTLSRAARLVTQGLPDEAATHVLKEMDDKYAVFAGRGARAVGTDALQRAMAEVSQVKDQYTSSTSAMNAEQKADLERFSQGEKQTDDANRKKQQKEQETLHTDKQRERDDMINSQKNETRQLDLQHQRQRMDHSQNEIAMKRQHDTETDKELKAFKEGQYREADVFKRRIATTRVEEEKRINMLNRQEHEAGMEARQLEMKELEAMQEVEKQKLMNDKESASTDAEAKYLEAKQALESQHAQNLSNLDATQEAEREAFESAKSEAEKSLLEDQDEATRDMRRQQERDAAGQKLARDDELRLHVEKQNEERKQIGLRHKEEIKQFGISQERRKTELSTKQEADRKEMFASRR